MTDEIDLADLKIGMYLINIVKPEGKFNLLKGGLIKSEKVLKRFQEKGVERVLVDPSKALLPSLKTSVESFDKQFFQQEIAKAKGIFNESKNIQRKLFHAAETGNPLDLTAVNKITDESIDILFKNPDALACVLNLRNKDEYLLEHSVAVSVLISIFSFYLKIETEIVRKLAVGAFLHDVGKIMIPDAILNKPEKLTEAEFTIMKTHASHSIKIVKQTAGIDALSLEVVALHHEQLSGLGYPHHVIGDDISQYGRMIAICDIFDALTSTRCYKKGLSQVQSFIILRSLSDSNHLDKQLVDQFIHCMGVYPVGAIVQLDNDHLAIVEAHNQDDPIRPRVKSFYSLGGKKFEHEASIDLSISTEKKIVKCVRADDFNLDMGEIIEYLAHQG